MNISQSTQWGIFLVRGGDMKKSNTNAIFWLGHALGAVAQALRSKPTGESFYPVAVTAESSLSDFGKQKHLLPLSREAAKDLTNALNVVYFRRLANSELLKTEPVPMAEPFSADEVGTLGASLFSFQSILSSELPQTDIYYVTPKCAYNTAVLMDDGERVLPEGTLDSLDQSRAKVLDDVRQATKCLAVSIPTAVGFHIYRAIEAIIIDEYFPLLDIEQPANRNLGEYIRLLKDKSVDDKITAILKHIKDHYRNPISHPEEFWDQTKANGAFGLAVSIITIMSQDIATRKPKPSVDTTEGEES
jgi:hypothetical protein